MNHRMSLRKNEFVSVHYNHLLRSGCPYCGNKNGFKFNIRPEGYSWQCNAEGCKKICFVLAKDLSEVPANLSRIIPPIFPESQASRPRRKKLPNESKQRLGIPVTVLGHRSAIDYCLCFACKDASQNLYWLKRNGVFRLGVDTLDDGKTVIQMFGYGAYILAKQKNNQGYFVVNIGVCKDHYDKLDYLFSVLREEPVLTSQLILAARNANIHYMTNQNY